jgi:carotenoid cleavage dioxygenase
MTTLANPYLEGNLAPVREEVTATELAVTGTIPEHLDGRYLRNGPNPVVQPDAATYHWFTGSGMVHGVRLRDGRAEWYRNRWVRSGEVAAALGEHARPGPVHAGLDFAANTNVIGHAGRTFAIVEGGGRPYELTDELGTVGPCDFDGTLKGGYTAHPKLDPVTGELHAISYFFGWGNTVHYTVLGTDGRIRRTVPIKVTGQPMMHDFSLTERHVVLYDLPVTLDPEQAAGALPSLLARPARSAMRRFGTYRLPDRVATLVGRSVGTSALPYSWNADYPARVGIMDRESDGRDVRWFDVEPCYIFHPLNAFDDGDNVVATVVRHPKMFATDHRGPNEGPPTLDRWTIDTSAGKVLEERLDDRGQEFPRVDGRLVGRRARYGYTVSVGEPANSLLRHDLVSGRTERRPFPAGSEVGEFVMVPTTPDAAEDDGVLMGFVHDPGRERSDLVLLDAATLDDVASVHLPARVPAGFHGNWIGTC